MEEPLSLTVIIPVYNEEKTIQQVLSEWEATLKQLVGTPFKILVLNDGSTDSTSEILNKIHSHHIEVLNKSNSGHGPSVQLGYQQAVDSGSHFIFQVDSDGQFIAKDFEFLWSNRAQYDILLGLRLNRHDPFFRLVISRLLRTISWFFFNCPIMDLNTPYRLMKNAFLRTALEEIPKDSLIPNIHLSLIAGKRRKAIFQVPITHLARDNGHSSLIKLKLLKFCWRAFQEIMGQRKRWASQSL